jgi:tRNA(Ile2)-agmatinylcytidine synthase
MDHPLYIGIDDTDSRKGMCTTYLGAVLYDGLSEVTEVTEARLVRLNPNIPWKTRGNAAVCLKLGGGRTSRIKEMVMDAVETLSDFSGSNTNPGVVFFQGEVPGEFTDFYRRALHGIVGIEEAEDLAEAHGAETRKFKNGRGIIGALAAIGADLTGDHTYEIIAYRPRERWGRERDVEAESVVRMDRETRPLTFNNIDPDTNRVLITPNTPCPILFGIRGEEPEVLRGARTMVVSEPPERELIYKTNQGTDAHLFPVKGISEVKPYSSIILEGRVLDKPRFERGGHLFFSITDGAGTLDCAAYEPTKGFRFHVEKLLPGDRVRIYGGVRDNGTVNLERLDVLELAEVMEEQNPLCGVCGKRMESAGTGQGFRCRRCRTKKMEKVRVKVQRELGPGAYQVPPGAMRHLTKPLSRFTLSAHAPGRGSGGRAQGG